MVKTTKYRKDGVKKGVRTAAEDRLLMSYVNKHGHPNWRLLPRLAGLARSGKSCRLRWLNYLPPMYVCRWSTIAANLAGRTDSDIKNHWHTSLKKKNKSSNIVSNDGESSKRTSKYKDNNKNSERELNSDHTESAVFPTLESFPFTSKPSNNDLVCTSKPTNQLFI